MLYEVITIRRPYAQEVDVDELAGPQNADLEKAMNNNPYASGEGKAVHFFFCDKEPKSVDYELLESVRANSEEYELGGQLHRRFGYAGKVRLGCVHDRPLPGSFGGLVDCLASRSRG